MKKDFLKWMKVALEKVIMDPKGQDLFCKEACYLHVTPGLKDRGICRGLGVDSRVEFDVCMERNGSDTFKVNLNYIEYDFFGNNLERALVEIPMLIVGIFFFLTHYAFHRDVEHMVFGRENILKAKKENLLKDIGEFFEMFLIGIEEGNASFSVTRAQSLSTKF